MYSCALCYRLIAFEKSQILLNFNFKLLQESDNNSRKWKASINSSKSSNVLFVLFVSHSRLDCILFIFFHEI